MNLINNRQIRDRLRDLQYIGPFPHGIEALLVPVDHAHREINSELENPLPISQFKKILREGDIFVFNTVEDWDKFKNPQKANRKRFEGFLR